MKLKLLLVEDNPDDALLVQRELQRGGFEVLCTQVDNKHAMRSAIDGESWDCVVSDYNLPHFSGLDALQTLKESGLDIPFLLVSGEIDEETAVAIMRSGAHDFVMKNKLGRLAPAIRRELDQAADRRARKQREREHQAIVELARALRKAKNKTQIQTVILDTAIEILDAIGAALVIRDPISRDLVIEEANGAWKNLHRGNIPEGEGLSGTVFASGEPYVSNDAQHEMSRIARPEILSATEALAGVPLIVDETVFGVLWIGRAKTFGGADVRVLTSMAEMSASAIHRVTLHEETRLRLRRLHSLRSIDLAITSGDAQMAFDVVLEQVIDQLGFDAACIFTFDRELRILMESARLGFDEHDPQFDVKICEGLAGEAARDEKFLVVEDIGILGNLSDRDQTLFAAGFSGFCAVPLLAKGELRGLLEVRSRSVLVADAECSGFLEAVAWQTATALDNVWLVDKLKRSNIELTEAYEAILEGWARALELRDQETEGHCRRVTKLTVQLGEALCLSDDDLLHIRRGALLHDVGKMGIPDSILLKPGPLDEDEWATMRLHPEYAKQMLLPLSYLRPAISIPYSHHEKWDGSGYPQGLKGEAIPIGARMFAIIDVWDALNSDRPYRKAWSKDRIIDHMREGSGTHFDPKVLEVFLDVVTRNSQ